MSEFRTNYHTHTTYCDGKNSPEEIVSEAVRLGMTELGFSGHSYTSIDESYCMSKEGMHKYFDEIGKLREQYAGKIRILRGIEMDYFSDPEDYGYDWDHIICSCHYIKKGGEFFPFDESEEILLDACSKYYGGDIYSLIADYYTEVGNAADVIRAGCINAESSADAKLVIGHFDLITKFNEGGKLFDESDKRYTDAWMSALDRLCSRHDDDIVFEINTGAMSRGYRTSPYPSEAILDELAKRGCRVILSSDSHDKATLMYGFDDAEALAEKAGLVLQKTI